MMMMMMLMMLMEVVMMMSMLMAIKQSGHVDVDVLATHERHCHQWTGIRADQDDNAEDENDYLDGRDNDVGDDDDNDDEGDGCWDFAWPASRLPGQPSLNYPHWPAFSSPRQCLGKLGDGWWDDDDDDDDCDDDYDYDDFESMMMMRWWWLPLTDPPPPPPPDNASGNSLFFNNAPHHAQISYTPLYIQWHKSQYFVLFLRLLPNSCYFFPAGLLIATEYVFKFTKYQNLLCPTIVPLHSRLWLNAQSKTMSMYYIVQYLL